MLPHQTPTCGPRSQRGGPRAALRSSLVPTPGLPVTRRSRMRKPWRALLFPLVLLQLVTLMLPVPGAAAPPAAPGDAPTASGAQAGLNAPVSQVEDPDKLLATIYQDVKQD